MASFSLLFTAFDIPSHMHTFKPETITHHKRFGNLILDLTALTESGLNENMYCKRVLLSVNKINCN